MDDNKKIFISTILEDIGAFHSNYPFMRKGQAVYNYIDKNYKLSGSTYTSIAHKIYKFDKIDCFEDDSKIFEFLEKVYDYTHN